MTISIPVAAILLFLWFAYPIAARSLRRLAIVAVPALAITSYLTIPFLLERAYLNQTPYLERWKYDSIGAGRVIASILDGSLFDYGRFPVITAILMLGLAYAIANRGAQARLALGLFAAWAALFAGRTTWGALADLMPLHDRLLFHRFVGGVDMGAILLVGLGGEWLWQRFRSLRSPHRIILPALLIAMLMAPAMRERWENYRINSLWMEQAYDAIRADEDRAIVLWELRRLPPGRVYAGLRSNWGEQLSWGFLHFYNLLPFEDFDAFCPPYYAFSLNSDLMWEFKDADPEYYRLFNVRYVVAPASRTMPAFLTPVLKTVTYAVYQADTGGYAQLARLIATRGIESQNDLLEANQRWIKSSDPGKGRFIAYSFPSAAGFSAGVTDPPDATRGTITNERVAPQRIEVQVENPATTTLVFKVTYHPNWRATVNGRAQQTFMVSPSFVAVALKPGRHEVRIEYHSSRLKNVLLLLGCLLVIGLFLPWTGFRLSSLRSTAS